MEVDEENPAAETYPDECLSPETLNKLFRGLEDFRRTLKCTACHQLVQDPVMISCMHRLCRGCVRDSQGQKCGDCGASFWNCEVREDRAFARRVEEWKSLHSSLRNLAALSDSTTAYSDRSISRREAVRHFVKLHRERKAKEQTQAKAELEAKAVAALAAALAAQEEAARLEEKRETEEAEEEEDEDDEEEEEEDEEDEDPLMHSSSEQRPVKRDSSPTVDDMMQNGTLTGNRVEVLPDEKREEAEPEEEEEEDQDQRERVTEQSATETATATATASATHSRKRSSPGGGFSAGTSKRSKLNDGSPLPSPTYPPEGELPVVEPMHPQKLAELTMSLSLDTSLHTPLTPNRKKKKQEKEKEQKKRRARRQQLEVSVADDLLSEPQSHDEERTATDPASDPVSVVVSASHAVSSAQTEGKQQEEQPATENTRVIRFVTLNQIDKKVKDQWTPQAAKLGITLSNKVQEDKCDLIITDVDPRNNFPVLTWKLTGALLLGKTLVTRRWMERCLERGEVLPVRPFRPNYRNVERGLFSGYRVLFSLLSERKISLLSVVLKMGGADIIHEDMEARKDRRPSEKKRRVVIVDNGANLTQSREEIESLEQSFNAQVVGECWIMDSVQLRPNLRHPKLSGLSAIDKPQPIATYRLLQT